MNERFENFTFLILKAGKLIQKIKNIEMRKFGLKAVHVMCIYYLNRVKEGLTHAELVKVTLEDKAAISRALSTLKSKKYITYDEKKYNGLISLTNEGKEVADIIEKRANNAVNIVGEILTEEERNRFYQSLNSLTENLFKYCLALEN